MCGIVGVLNVTNSAPINSERLRAANDSLAHRGPDDEGVYVEPSFGMGARRLSIIDRAHGRQPISNETGTVFAVCNGEIYNHAALRRELELNGHQFRTHADTEVIVHGYEQWGRDGLLSRLRGMFAFAIWDTGRRALFLARDRMGMKPLYLSELDGRLYFASEIRGILHQSETPRRPNLDALGLYMRIGFVTSPHTMLEGVRKLPPAHYLWAQDGRISTQEYWTLSYEQTNRHSDAEIIDAFRSCLKESISAHLMSEVPIGALLSGGVDSNATVAFMDRLTDVPVKTVTVGFDGTHLDESQWAADSARALGTDHHTVRFTRDTMADYPTVLHFQEEPFARPTNAAVHHVFKACRERGFKVVVTGEGADELLGGYRWHKGRRRDRLISRLPRPWRSGLAWFGSRQEASASIPHGYARMIGIGDVDLARSLLQADVRSLLEGDPGDPIIDAWASWLGCVAGAPKFEQLLWLQSRTRLADYTNSGLDRQSMAHSIEARPPFQDHTLWEFCATLPTGLKLRDATEKYVLREAGRNVVPEPARTRRKAPLRVPFERWLTRDRLPDWAEEALSESQLQTIGLFDPAAVIRLRRTVQRGDLKKAPLLSAALNMQAWAHIFL